MTNNPLPQEDQQVTLISVRDGNISVTSARALVVKPRKLALKIDASLSEPPVWSDEQALTMIYTHGDRVMRLRGILREQVDAERITVEPVGEVKEGDRRDYRRADVEARIFSRPVNTQSPSEARKSQLAHAVPQTSPLFEVQTVNISGSGVSFTSSQRYVQGELVDLRLILEQPAAAVVTVVGQVVRAVEGTPHSYAVRFAELSEADQDIIVYTVFSNHFAAEGLSDALDDLSEDDL